MGPIDSVKYSLIIQIVSNLCFESTLKKDMSAIACNNIILHVVLLG